MSGLLSTDDNRPRHSSNLAWGIRGPVVGRRRWASEKWNSAVSAVFDYGIMLQVRFAETRQDFDFEGVNIFIKP